MNGSITVNSPVFCPQESSVNLCASEVVSGPTATGCATATWAAPANRKQVRRRSHRFLRLINQIIIFIEFVLYSVQGSVKTFLPGFWNGWLKYCATVHFWGGQQNS